jgi:protein-S-isoprenylcysteine O-methyltransferase Ste14
MPQKFIQDRPPVMVHPPVLVGAAVALGLVLEWFIPTSVLRPPLNYWIGVPLIALSALLVGMPALQFLKAKTGVATFQPATALVTSGVYGLSRNPIYIGLVAGLLGLALLVDSLWLLLLVPIVALVLDRGVILREETYLEEKFGEDYRDYKRRVRRWL